MARNTLEPVSDMESARKHAKDGRALRAQPPAPGATKYYFIDEDGSWRRQTCGQTATRKVQGDIKEILASYINRGSLSAVDREEKNRYT